MTENKKGFAKDYTPKSRKRRSAICKKCGGSDFYKNGQCKPCKIAYTVAYYRTNIEMVKKRTATWYYETIEARKNKNIEWRSANPEKVKAYNASWQRQNPKIFRIYNQNRRGLKLSNGGKLSKGLSDKLYKIQDGKCACCGKLLGSNFHLDHIMPISLGGVNEDYNIQLLTQRCNIQKGGKHPLKYMQEKIFLNKHKE